jgi:2-polyprenyl-3-methyl-5-hydroxy-6-metoxy-1,4-benzoquinol methylase
VDFREGPEFDMQTIDIDQCSVTGKPGNLAYAEVTDHFFGTPGTWRYMRDSQTGHLWLNPRPADAEIPGLYARYHTHEQNQDSASQSLLERAFALVLHRRLGYALETPSGLLERMVTAIPSITPAGMLAALNIPAAPAGSLLDFGCGGGQFMSRFARAGWEVRGVEPDPVAAATLRARSGYDIRSELDHVDDWRQTFDIVSLNHVIEHLPDPADTLRRLSTCLKPGGRFAIATPNASSLGRGLFGKHWRGLEPPRHFNVFTPKSLRATLESAGLNATALSTEARIAQFVFLCSYLAKTGRKDIQLSPLHGARAAKLCGYLFQIAEQILKSILPDIGEEIYCLATVR